MRLMKNMSSRSNSWTTSGEIRSVIPNKQGTNDGFTKRYRMNRLVWLESGGDVMGAIAREMAM